MWDKGKSWIDIMIMERVGDRWKKMEGYCSTGQSPQRAVVPVEEEEEMGDPYCSCTFKL
jgi:hypothetical protein